MTRRKREMYPELRAEDFARAEELMTEVERICEYWKQDGSLRKATALRTRMMINRKFWERAAAEVDRREAERVSDEVYDEFDGHA